MENIIAILESVKIDINDIDPHLKYAINFYDAFFSKYPVSDLASYQNLDYLQYIILFLSRSNPESLSNIEKFIYSNEKFFRKLTPDQLICLFVVLMHPIFREIYALKKSIKIFVKVFDVQKLALFEQLDPVATTDVATKLLRKPVILTDFINLLDSLEFTLNDARRISGDLDVLNKLSILLTNSQENKTYFIKLTSKGGVIEGRPPKKNLEKNAVIAETGRIIRTRYNETFEVRKGYNNDCIMFARRNRLVDQMLGFVRENPDYMPYDVLKKVMGFRVPEDVKEAFLDYAGSLNAKVEAQKLEEYEASQNSQEKIIGRLLARFGIDIELLAPSERQSVLEIPLEDLEIVLNFLLKNNISYSSEASFLLYDAEKIKIVSPLLDKKILTEDFIKDNLRILLKDNDELGMVVGNIDLLYSHGINIINYRKCLAILFQNIQAGIALLDIYALRVNKKTKSINFLGDLDLAFKLDLVIEMDLYDGRSLDILNDSLEVIYQRGLCKKLNIKYDANLFKAGNIEECKPNPSVLIPDDILKLFAQDKTIGVLPSYLEGFVVDERSLVIGGIIISLPRMLRNLSVIDSSNPEEVYMAALYGGYYTLEEALIIQKAIAPELKDVLLRQKKNEE